MEKKQKESNKSEWALYIILIVLVLGAFFAFQRGGENQARAECVKLEQKIAADPTFQSENVTCNCFPGSQYFDKIAPETDQEVIDRADLWYVVSCNIAGENKIFPIWKTK